MFFRGTELRCTLWGVYAQQFSDFLNNCDDHGKIIVVVQLAMTKIWDGMSPTFYSLLFLSLYKFKCVVVNLYYNCTICSCTGKMCIQNGFHGTKLFLFNGNKTIDTDEFPEVETFRQRFLYTTFKTLFPS